jgi:hypothetical protein
MPFMRDPDPDGGKNVCEQDDSSISATQECPDKTRLSKAKRKKCHYQSMNVQAGDRTYNSEKNDEELFEIVCGNKVTSKDVDCTLQGLVGPPSASKNSCDHRGKVFDIQFDADSVSDSEMNFKAQTFFDVTPENIPDNLSVIIWPPRAESKEYEINANTCGKWNSMRLIAYPDLETSFSFKTKEKEGLAFVLMGKGSEESESLIENLFDGKIGKYFHGELESKYDGNSFLKISLGKRDDQEKFLRLPSVQTLKLLFKGVTGFKDAVNDVLGRGNGSLTLTFAPVVSLSCKMEEDFDGPTVDYKAGLTFGFDPLLKLKGVYDFLGPALKFIPGIGTALIAIRWLLEKCNAAEVNLQISFEGSVSFTGSINKTGKEWQGDIDPKGKVELKVEFIAKYNINISYGIGAYSKSGSFQAAAKGGVKAEPTKDRAKKYKFDRVGGVSVFLDLKFTGAYLYWLTGTTSGGAVSTPGGIPAYAVKAEVSNLQNDEESETIPDDQKYVVMKEKSLWQGYLDITSE